MFKVWIFSLMYLIFLLLLACLVCPPVKVELQAQGHSTEIPYIMTNGSGLDLTYTCGGPVHNMDMVHVYHQVVFYLQGPKGPKEEDKIFMTVPFKAFPNAEEALTDARNYAIEYCPR